MLHTVLVNPPVSSPIHPQLNLPLLKGYLQAAGYKVKVYDTNILFYHWFLGENPKMELEDCLKNPLSLLSYYSEFERRVAEKSKEYDGLHVGLRSLSMKYDRIYFDPVIEALEDEKANPFIRFYSEFIEKNIQDSGLKIIGIAITFQDQIIPAFTLASLMRKKMPHVKIVMGGQMITRCYDSMMEHKHLCTFYDYLALWDGEKGIHDIHKEVIDGKEVQFVNVRKVGSTTDIVNRTMNSPSSDDIPSPDFTDIDFNAYIYPDVLVPFQTTRGCYGKCAFCAIPFGSNGYKVRKVDRIIDDLIRIQNEIKEKHNRKATFFKFMEDLSAPALLFDLSYEIGKRGLEFKWETFARLEKAFAAPDFLKQLYRGGCRKIHWGLESNDPAILKTMNKKSVVSVSDDVLRLAGEAGIMNFCFILVGFPGETDESRHNVTQYIINNPHIHTLTLSTFDLTRGSPMAADFSPNNIYKLSAVAAQDFQVRLPYLVDGKNWKKEIVMAAHKMMIDIIKGRPDIGFTTLFPDQIRSLFCDKFGNDWGKTFVARYGQDGVREILLNAEQYASDYQNGVQISPDKLPEPIRREHYRTKEDLTLIAKAMLSRRDYEGRRFEQV